MLNRVKEFLLKFGARYEGFIWFTLVGLSILPRALFFATTSYISGHLRATLKRRREQDE
jgi:hypothetical protein